MRATTTRPPFWRDVRILRLAFQLVVVAVVAAFGLWLWRNLRANAAQTSIPLDFDYLDQPADFTIPGSSFRPTQSVRDAVAVGLGNTIRVALAGIVLSTVVGTLVGIARLSENWLLSNVARVFVEAVRNVPLLIIVLFSYVAIALQLPRIENATEYGVIIPSVRGVGVVWYRTGGEGWAILALLGSAAAAWWAVARWRRGVQDRTGQAAHAVIFGLAAFVVVTVIGLATLGNPLSWSTPSIDGRRIVGGITLGPEYAALLGALVVYTSSHVAEIVRGSIQAVPKGQFEAASAVALSAGQRMRLVILPQAMRIAVPALGNQYLNLTKNSSLGVAISYFEVTKVTSVSVGNRAPAVPSYALLLVIYLVLSLVLSALVNRVNRRLALVER